MLLNYDFMNDVLERHYKVRDGLGWYHGTGHIRKVLDMLWRMQIDEPALSDDMEYVLEYAALYHDAVYVPGSRDNEKWSAEVALDEAKNVELTDCERKYVEQLILSTDVERVLGSAQVDMSWIAGTPGANEWWTAHNRLHDADWSMFRCWDEMLDSEDDLMREAEAAAVTRFGQDCDKSATALKGRLAFLERVLEHVDSGKKLYALPAMQRYERQAALNIRAMISRIEDELADG